MARRIETRLAQPAHGPASGSRAGGLQNAGGAPTVAGCTPFSPPDGRNPAVQILPAIDLRGGQCVRLRQGDYGRETVFGADPAATAKRWVEEGATYLHLVDLDGAKE